MSGRWNGKQLVAAPGRTALVVAVLAGAVVFGTLVGGSPRAAGDEGKTKFPADLDRIPRDGVAFASVRVADLWDHEAGKKLRKELGKDLNQFLEQWQQAIGVPPEQVERWSIVLTDFDPRSEPRPLFFVATTEPYDRAKVIAAVAPEAKEEMRKGQMLYVGTRGHAIHFIDDRAFVVSSTDGVRALLERRVKKEGPLTAALQLVAGKHALVAGLNPETVVKEVRDKLPPQAEPFKPLLETDFATVVVDLDKDLSGKVRLSFTGEKEAKEGRTAVQMGLGLAQIGLAQGIQQMKKEGKDLASVVDLLEQAKTMLKEIEPKQNGLQVEVSLRSEINPAALVAALAPAVVKAREAAARVQSQSNLKQIALAMHNYHDQLGLFPARAVFGPDGKPLLSWRVLILPYIDQDALYKEFHLNEPWDSEHNKKLLVKMPKTYALPQQPKGATETFYQGFVGKEAFFQGSKGIRIQDITDGTSNTILIVEAGNGVPWTKPEDLPFDPDPEKPLPKVGGHFTGGFNAAICDGSVRFIKKSVPAATLRALITCSGGEVIGNDF